MQDGLVLRDVHRPPTPPLWPPAPGWWVLVLVIVVVALAIWMWRRRRGRRRARAIALFDDALAGTDTPSLRLGRASELLRRAARGARADADRLEGDAWLAFLDTPRTRFTEGAGRLLLDGAFRPDVDARAADDTVRLARERFVELMERRR